MASAMEIRSRLWLGSVISQHREVRLIRGLLIRVRACGPVEKILLVTATGSQATTAKLSEGLQGGAPHWQGRPSEAGALGTGVMIARVIKRYQRRRVVEVMRRVVAGREAEVISRVIATQRSMLALINTAYIERLQATFRARLAPLVRRSSAGAHKHCTLEKWGCGWRAVATTSCGRIALLERSAPRRWQQGLQNIVGRWRSC